MLSLHLRTKSQGNTKDVVPNQGDNMGRSGLTNPTLARSPKAEQMIPQQATNDKTPGAATAPGNNERKNFSNKRDNAPPI